MVYNHIAVNTIVKNRKGEVSSCDIAYDPELKVYNRQYLKYTHRAARDCRDQDLSQNYMVIGTSAIIDTDMDGAHAGAFLANLQNQINGLRL